MNAIGTARIRFFPYVSETLVTWRGWRRAFIHIPDSVTPPLKLQQARPSFSRFVPRKSGSTTDLPIREQFAGFVTMPP